MATRRSRRKAEWLFCDDAPSILRRGVERRADCGLGERPVVSPPASRAECGTPSRRPRPHHGVAARSGQSCPVGVSQPWWGRGRSPRDGVPSSWCPCWLRQALAESGSTRRRCRQRSRRARRTFEPTCRRLLTTRCGVLIVAAKARVSARRSSVASSKAPCSARPFVYRSFVNNLLA